MSSNVLNEKKKILNEIKKIVVLFEMSRTFVGGKGGLKQKWSKSLVTNNAPFF